MKTSKITLALAATAVLLCAGGIARAQSITLSATQVAEVWTDPNVDLIGLSVRDRDVTSGANPSAICHNASNGYYYFYLPHSDPDYRLVAALAMASQTMNREVVIQGALVGETSCPIMHFSLQESP